MKRQCQIDPTHIDELPNDLAQDILMRLSIRDAVRTSILSRRWRFVWTERPKLVFDDKLCEESFLKTKSKLMKAISQVILLHQGPLNKFELSVSHLDKFEFSVSYLDKVERLASHLEGSCSEIDQFILIVLRKGVKDLTFHSQNGLPYRLPSSVFAYSQQLERLQFHSCVFKPPSGFSGFSKLETLLLNGYCISGDRFSNIISNCPVLESLTFLSSTRCSPIDIVAPNLKYLKADGYLQPLCFKNTPKLASVEISCGYTDHILREMEASSQSILCGRLPVVEKLVLDYRYAKYVALKRASALLVKDLCHLKTLYLLSICFGIFHGANHVFSLLCLIRNSPNLENLKVSVYTNKTAIEVNLANLAEAEEVSLDHLKKVELGQVSGLKCELQFIKLILTKSPVLEKFLIIPDSNLVGDKGLKFFKELSTFRWASPLVEIAYEG